MTTSHLPSVPDLTNQTVIVTGANSGIGLRAARALAAHGAHVVFAVRNTTKGEAAASATTGSTEVRDLDLANLASVRAFAADWDGPINILINNAGVSSPSLSRTADGFEMALGTNHLGHFALTNLLLDNITGRVVTVASQAERTGRIDFDDLNWERTPYKQSRSYANSKLANLLFTAELQRRLSAAGSEVIATAAHPGFVDTSIYDPADPESSNRVLALAIRLLAQDAESGALPVLYAAVADIPGNSFAGPKHLAHMRGAPELIRRSKTARDENLARRLWTASEQLTGVQFPALKRCAHRQATA